MKNNGKLAMFRRNWKSFIFGTWFLVTGFYGLAASTIGRTGIIDHFDTGTIEYTPNYNLGITMLVQTAISWIIETFALAGYLALVYLHRKLKSSNTFPTLEQ